MYQEDGSIGGLVNSTFGEKFDYDALAWLTSSLRQDTTSKVITERRLVLLRELNNNAGMFKNIMTTKLLSV